MKEGIATYVSAASFLLSIYTLWATQLRKGRLKMTRPTLLCLTRDYPSMQPKIFLRTLLYSTVSKGQVIKNMFLKVFQNNSAFIFNFWGHTEKQKLILGSGMFVGNTGVPADHHFNQRHGSGDFLFLSGDYRVEVFASLVGISSPKKLSEVSFTVDSQQSAELIQIVDLDLFLFWNAEKQVYEGELDRRPRDTGGSPSTRITNPGRLGG